MVKPPVKIGDIEKFIKTNIFRCSSKKNTYICPEFGVIVNLKDVKNFVNSVLKFSYSYEYGYLSSIVDKCIKEVPLRSASEIEKMDIKNESWNYFYKFVKIDELKNMKDFYLSYQFGVGDISEREFLEAFKFWIYEHGFVFHRSMDAKTFFVFDPTHKYRSGPEIEYEHTTDSYEFFSKLETNKTINCREIYNRYCLGINEVKHKKFFSILRNYLKNNNIKHSFDGKGTAKTLIIF